MIKLDEVKNVQESNVKPIKDTLYAKFATKDSAKYDKNVRIQLNNYSHTKLEAKDFKLLI